MSAVVFCGPSLRAEDLARYPRFAFHPPVRQGELYAAARTGAQAIGVIDGYFDGVPAIWHKEVLWALANGVAVFGAASMGALRAAELHPFGMRGVGRIFEDYRDGRLTDDGDVALLHGPPETGYLHLSEPMVNVRATLQRALSQGVVAAAEADAISAVATAQFYQERTWASVLSGARARLPDASVDRFAAWLPAGKVDQKREDAVRLLEEIDDFVARGGRPSPASFAFEWTETWANAPWLNAARGEEEGRGDGGEAILDELRLQPAAYRRARRAALLRQLVREEVARAGLEPDRRALTDAAAAIRTPRGLIRQADVRRWAAENDIDPARFERLIADRAGLTKIERARDQELRPLILDQLRLEDAYQALRDRARAKADWRVGGGRGTTALTRATVPPPALASWYFRRLGTAMPDDLAAFVADLGLSGLDEFYDLIAAEYSMAAGAEEPARTGKP